MLKRLIYDKVIELLSPSLSTHQFGFLLEKSTLQQLLVFLHEVCSNLSEKIQTTIIYLDIRKAFDRVPHDKLLANLGPWIWVLHIISGHGLYSLFSNRSQRVSINGVLPESLPVTSGVP